ncbi:hypothetical protein [Billgrantia gudaonensis]|uniref:Uncharacterized protein n=1 Tax=Billgrantia gudaonensis TaxID=376427 RepID=A0A1G8XFK4_9GAMM|nr:hypothetical protein [Halomonas gudaonensis]SDJ88715.1 hypothetical protein SAMN04487954_10912 [Halomonas gudaonensis]
MKSLIATAGLIAGIAMTTSALACDPSAAEERWGKAEEEGIVLGAGMVNDLPSFAVDEAVWDQLDLNTRTAMAETFECVIAGPESILAKAQVLTNGGEVLAIWDGIDQELDIK